MNFIEPIRFNFFFQFTAESKLSAVRKLLLMSCIVKPNYFGMPCFSVCIHTWNLVAWLTSLLVFQWSKFWLQFLSFAFYTSKTLEHSLTPKTF